MDVLSSLLQIFCSPDQQPLLCSTTLLELTSRWLYTFSGGSWSFVLTYLCRLWQRAPKLYSVEVIQDGRTVSTIPGSHLCYPVYFVLSRLAGMLNGAIDMYYALCPADQMQLIITNSEQHSWRISKVATVDKLSSLENFDKPTVLW